MKKLLAFLFCTIPLMAQGTPNCSQALTFTSAVPGAAINTTAGATAGCTGWRLTWQVTGFTAVQIQLEGSQDNSTWNAFSGALVIEGANPTNWTSATTSNTIVVRASLPYVRVDIVSKTGTGTIKTTLLGYSGTSAQWDSQGPGGTCGALGGDLSGTCAAADVVNLSHVTNGSLADSGLVNTPVHLQAATPGTPQTGNANISGRWIGGSMLLSNNPAATAVGNNGFDLVEDGAPAALAVTNYGISGATNSPGFFGLAARGSLASPTAVQSGDVLFSLGGKGWNGSAFTSSTKGNFRITANQTWTVSNNGTFASVLTTPNNSTTTFERVRFWDHGGVSINNPASGAVGADPGAGGLSIYGLQGAGTRCVHVDNGGVLSVAGSDCGSGGTVTVVGGGSLTSTAVMTGGGTTTAQTPSVTATLDASGNYSTPGNYTSGNTGANSGCFDMYGKTSGNIGSVCVADATAAGVLTHPGATGTIAYVPTPGTSGHIAVFGSDGVGLADGGSASTPAVVQIGQVVTAASATSVTFSAIPGTFTNLRLVYTVSSQQAANTTTMYLKLNSDATSGNYDTGQYILAEGTTIVSNSVASTTAGGFMGDITGSTGPANYWTQGTALLNSYSGTLAVKRVGIKAYTSFGAGNAEAFEEGVFTWKNTAAITRIDVSLASGSAFANGSTVTLYGER